MKPGSTPLDELSPSPRLREALTALGATTLKGCLMVQPWELESELGEELSSILKDAGVHGLSFWARLDPPRPESLPSTRAEPRHTLVFRSERIDGPVSRAGGRPSPWTDGSTWPVSRGSGAPLDFMLQLVARPEGDLDLGPHGALQLFMDAKELHCVPRLGLAQGTGPSPPTRVFPSFRILVRPEADDRNALDPRIVSEASYWAAVSRNDVSKIGGLLSSQRLSFAGECHECGASLGYFAQFSAGLLPAPEGARRGRLVIFSCPGRHRFEARHVP